MVAQTILKFQALNYVGRALVWYNALLFNQNYILDEIFNLKYSNEKMYLIWNNWIIFISPHYYIDDSIFLVGNMECAVHVSSIQYLWPLIL